MLRITTALLLLSPAIASAQCLTAASLDGGITVEYGSGDISYIQRQPDGTILDAFTESSSEYAAVMFFGSTDGVMENHLTTHRNDTWEIRSATSKAYDFAPESLGAYAPGSHGTGMTTWAGNQYSSGDYSFTWMVYESDPLVVGDCSYDTVRIFTYELNIPNGDFYAREIKFLPELGIGLQIGNSYFSFSPENAEIIGLSTS